ncbi:MAG TPA: hypothetical protein GXZ95_04420 [Mollicutes bacterium]|nr:hypothetical protein [Mollicutes bacterium]
MMKNTEWGAIAYLSKSIYGQGSNEVWINPADNFTTGCAGDSFNSSPTSGCLRKYNTPNGQKASTTGNIYGVYDMSGGACEYTASYINNGHNNLTEHGKSAFSSHIKYIDIYKAGSVDSDKNNYNSTIYNKGDAIYETSNDHIGIGSWYSDFSFTPKQERPWFRRGGDYTNGNAAGVFAFYDESGAAISYFGFRPTLFVGPEL